MSKKHKRSKKKTTSANKKDIKIKVITPTINIESEKKDTSLQELINNRLPKEITKKNTTSHIDKEILINNDKPEILTSVTNNEEPFTKIEKSKKLQEKITPQKVELEKKQKLTTIVPTTQTEKTEISQKKEIIQPQPKLQEKNHLKNKESVIRAKKKVSENETLTVTKKTISKLYIVVIILLTTMLIGLITILVYLSTSYYQLIENNYQLQQEITTTNTKITNTETTNTEINNQITDKEKILKDKIKEYNIWVKLKEKIEKALS